jgi:acyl carrier protein
MREKITKLLADFLGVETTDITPDDSLIEDLHMTPTDLADFVEILATAGLDTTKIDMTEIETLNDLYEKYI